MLLFFFLIALIEFQVTRSTNSRSNRELSKSKYDIFQSSDEKLNFWNANNYCIKNFKSNLVTITSNKTYEEFIKELNSKNISEAWIGLSDFGKEGRFYWISGYNSTKTNFWEEGYPRDARNSSDCVVTRLNDQGQYRWVDVHCAEIHNFVCMRMNKIDANVTDVLPPLSHYTNQCPKPYFPVDGDCFWITSENLTWNKSRNACQQKEDESDLATIRTIFQQEYFASLISGNASALWIGLNYYNKDYQWILQHGITITNWGENEPNIHQGECTYISGNEHQLGEWYITNCSKSMRAICQTLEKNNSLPKNYTNVLETDVIYDGILFQKGDCKPGYNYYHGSCYKLLTEKSVNYNEAQKLCKYESFVNKSNFSISVNLVNFENSGEKYLILSNLRRSESDLTNNGLWLDSKAFKTEDHGSFQIDLLNNSQVSAFEYAPKLMKKYNFICFKFLLNGIVNASSCDKLSTARTMCKYQLNLNLEDLNSNKLIASCPEHWVRFNSFCFYFEDVAYKSHYQARKKCMKLNSFLPSIDMHQQNFLKDHMKKRREKGLNVTDSWIGLEIVKNSDSIIQYKWSNEKLMSYINLKNAEFVFQTKSKKKWCAVFSADNGVWKVVSCMGTSASLICQMEANITRANDMKSSTVSNIETSTKAYVDSSFVRPGFDIHYDKLNWKEALEKYNKFIISDDNHHFLYINNKGEEEQLFYEDWNTFVKDLDILSFENFSSSNSSISEQICSFRTIKLEQTHGNLDTNLYKLEKMIGLKKDFMVAVIPEDELSLFEESSRKLLVDASKEYDAKSLEEKLLIEHPIEINNSKTEPKSYNIKISVALDQSESNSRNCGILNSESHRKGVIIDSTDTIPMVVLKVVSKFNERPEYSLNADDFILKISDREEYLVSLKSIPIIKFQHINLCVQRNTQPLLVLVSKLTLNQIYKVKPTRNVVSRIIPSTTTNENEFRSSYLEENEYIYVHDLWKHFIKSSNINSIDDERDSINSINNPLDYSLHCVLDNLEASDFLYEVKIVKIELPPSIILKDQKIVIVAGLFHGGKSLCEPQYREWSLDSLCCPIVFTLPLWNLPRMTRFCFALAVVKQTLPLKDIANNTQKKFIGWGNTMIYDHKGILKSDEIRYRLWSSVKPNLNPTGSVYSNPDGQLIAPLLAIQFVPKLSKFKKIVYPAKEKLILEGGYLFNNAHTNEPSTENEKEDIKKYLQADFSDDAMQEQEILWKYRYYIRNTYQDSLPKILNSKPWNSFENISMMHHVMCGWPIDKDIIIALELLGSNFPDCDTRLMAVDSLSRIDWQEISLYLLQICQCLKYESYLNSNFIQWLLKIMISNAKIAQTIFYFMKVELSTCEWCKVLFATILYNYLHYSRTRCDSLLKQYYATNELGLQNKTLLQLTSLEGERKNQALQKFRHSLESDESQRLFNELTCPLDCNIKLKTLDASHCKFMDSKMRPIRLTWKVSTEFATEYMIIYKNGDDLRQDSLVLQIMHIMDTIWQRKDLDLKLHPYDVLACSKTEGYIQVVKNAETIANISRTSKILNWLKEFNTEKEMEIVVKNFTRSLAAYCVATFILGIGDRHNDNIMLTKNGHFFHIDFGHILGNFKRIMRGMVSREWTKFILVQEFLDVVESEDDFRNLCCDGYIAIRDHSNLIFSLFKAMVNAGIPEISSIEDLNYLKETLQIGKGDEEARSYFQNVYADTRKKEVFITMNWGAHSIRRNNT